MRILFLIACALVLGLLVGCGGSGEEAGLAPSVLLKRIDAQFDLQEGSDSPEGEALVKIFPNDSLISCWKEDANRVCAVTFASFPSGGQSFSRTLDYWDFYLAVFEPGSKDPDIEQVDAEEALSPSRRNG